MAAQVRQESDQENILTDLRLQFGAAIISSCADAIDSRGGNRSWKSASRARQKSRRKKTGIPATTSPPHKG